MSEWSVKLCDCCHTPKICLWSFFVPCGIPCLQATAARIVIREENSYIKAFLLAACFFCIGIGINRTNIRKHLSIKGGLYEDICFSLWLPCCSVVQEWREVMKFKGKDEDEFISTAGSEYTPV